MGYNSAMRCNELLIACNKMDSPQISLDERNYTIKKKKKVWM